MPASGPGYWLECGTDFFDIIISEFRINERNPTILKMWYNHTRMHARHTLILDLWSWLTPPTLLGNPQTLQSAQVGGFLSNNTDSRFSFLSLAERDALSWRDNLWHYFNYSETKEPIPDECYAAAWERNSTEKNINRSCRQVHANAMQHGMEPFHWDVAELVAKHLISHVFPLLSIRDDQIQLNETRDKECFGVWGIWPSLLPVNVASWERVLLQKSGFQFGNPHSDAVTKKSLYTDSLNATLTLDCPEQYPFLKFGFISHSNVLERAKFLANDIEVDTWLQEDERPNIRVRIFSNVTNTPLRIVPSELRAGAYIEITNIVCMPTM